MSILVIYYWYCGMENLCGMLMIKMRKFIDDFELEVSVFRVEYYVLSYNN